MSIFSSAIDFFVDNPIVSTVVGGIFQKDEGGGRGFANQREANLSEYTRNTLSQAERLRRLGGANAPMNRISVPAKQRSQALDGYIRAMQGITQRNPYYSHWVNYQNKFGESSKQIADVLDEKDASIMREAATRTKIFSG